MNPMYRRRDGKRQAVQLCFHDSCAADSLHSKIVVFVVAQGAKFEPGTRFYLVMQISR